jgi:hypothetical protein
MTIRALPDAALDHVMIELPRNGEPLGHIILDPATAEKHARDIASARAALNEPVTPSLDPGSRLETIIDPAWHISGRRTSLGRLLAIRHPGLGWLAFTIPEAEAAAIAEWLTKDIPLEPTISDPHGE